MALRSENWSLDLGAVVNAGGPAGGTRPREPERTLASAWKGSRHGGRPGVSGTWDRSCSQDHSGEGGGDTPNDSRLVHT